MEKTGLLVTRRRHVGREEFECDEPVKPAILGFVDHAHAALTKLFENPVVGNDRGDQGSLLYG
jgi:hypothetical protein